MTPFLQQVAHHYTGKNIGNYCFIFPSRRALIFFKKYLQEEIKGAHLDAPVAASKMYCSYRSFCGGSRTHAYAMTGDYLAEEPFCAHEPHRR